MYGINSGDLPDNAKTRSRSEGYQLHILFLHKNIGCGYSLEVPQCFGGEKKKTINTLWLIKVPCLELCG